MTGVEDAYWTLEQAVSWILTSDRELVARNSASALASHIGRYDTGPKIHKTRQTPLLQFAEANREAKKLFTKAMGELNTALQRGELVASGIPKGSRDRVLIDRIYWVDHLINEGPDGVLIDGKGRLGRFSARYDHIRIEQAAVLNKWPEKSPKAAATGTGAKQAQRWLLGKIRESPHEPTMRRDETIQVMMSLFNISREAAKRARELALAEANAPAWTRPGRPPKKIEPPKSNP
jgi:hypothetical protein